MKKIFAFILCFAMLACILTGCGAKDVKKDKLKIVTTIFPEYDWVKQILGDKAKNADLTMLLDNGVDLHSYQPSAEDIIKISSCDMFIYVGGESDSWVKDVLKNAVNKNMVVINLLEVLGDDAKEEEIKEGMQGDHDHEHEHDDEDDHDHDHDHDEDDHDHDHDHDEDDHDHDHDEDDHDHEEETEYDEHVWLSLKNAAKLCKHISEKLGEIDVSNKVVYAANADAYIAKLNALDAKYAEAVGAAKTKTLLFGDRFPFRYLTDDYGLDYYAAFVGCSAESEASFETIVFLSKKVDELGLGSIMQIESADGKIAKTIKENTKTKDQAILTLDSMQSTTLSDVNGGASYLGIMEKNLNVLKDALK